MDIYWNFRMLNIFYVIWLVWSTGISEFKWVVHFLNVANLPELSRSDGAQMFIACWPTNTHLRLTALPQNRVYLLQCKRDLWHQWFGCELFGDLKIKEKIWNDARPGGVAGDAGEQVERGREGDADGDSEGEALCKCASWGNSWERWWWILLQSISQEVN